MCRLSGLFLLVAVCAAGVAAQEFPFRNGPLDPSLHSNKIFLDVDNFEDLAGVWTGVTYIGHDIARSRELARGEIPINEICARAHEGGIDYSTLVGNPHAGILLPKSGEDGVIGTLMDTFPGQFNEYSVAELGDGVLRLTDGGCRWWRPYFDWEIGKLMLMRNRRFYLWEENGEIVYDRREFCGSDMGHPYCSEGSFILDGEEKTGVSLDMMMFYECTAGPCLELPHTLPGYVKTQGWQPRDG